MITKYDYELLCFIDSHEYPAKEDIAQAFGRGYQARLGKLEKMKAVKEPFIPDGKGDFVLAPGYAITDEGYMLMQDYSYNVAFSLARLWEERYWKLAPIIISIIALIKSFWPEISTLWQTLR